MITQAMWISMGIGVLIIAIAVVCILRGECKPEKKSDVSRLLFVMGLVWIVVGIVVNNVLLRRSSFPSLSALGALFVTLGSVGWALRKSVHANKK